MSTFASSKRPSTSQQVMSNKRPRCDVSESVDDVDEGEAGQSGEMEQAMKDKIARKDARTIRNRESAQRSRNQRKNHLADLEVRVVELEEENQRLRDGNLPSCTSPASTSSPSTTIPSSDKVTTPYTPPSTISPLAILGINPAPPSFTLLDIKPVRTPTPSDLELHRLQTDNTALREKVRMLEGLLKQVVAVGNFGEGGVGLGMTLSPGVSTIASSNITDRPTLGIDIPSMDTKDLSMEDIFGLNPLNTTPILPAQYTFPQRNLDLPLDKTLSPQPLDTLTSISNVPAPTSFHTSQSTYPVSTLNPTPTLLPGFGINTPPNSNLACHPAAVVTSSHEVALQRARTSLEVSNLDSRASSISRGLPLGKRSAVVITEERLMVVARVLVGLARARGWMERRGRGCGRGMGWEGKCGVRRGRRERNGMRVLLEGLEGERGVEGSVFGESMGMGAVRGADWELEGVLV